MLRIRAAQAVTKHLSRYASSAIILLKSVAAAAVQQGAFQMQSGVVCVSSFALLWAGWGVKAVPSPEWFGGACSPQHPPGGCLCMVLETAQTTGEEGCPS